MTNTELISYMKTSSRAEWLLCRDCIDAIRSRGERLFVGDCVVDGDYAEMDGDFSCEFCGEYADLYECL